MNTNPTPDTTATDATAPAAPVVKPEATERPHHPYSPSQLQNIEACPPYIGRSTVTERAVAGTLGHKVVETGEDDEKLSDFDFLAAAECLDFVEQHRRILEAEARAAYDKALEESIANGTDSPDPKSHTVEELKEIYLPIDDIKFDDCVSTTAGYVDHVFINWNRTRAVVIDWKFGFHQVEDAKDNLQGIAYSLGLFKKFPSLQTVDFWFKQPHIHFLTNHVFSRADIPELYLRIQTVVARAREARKADDFKTANPMAPVCNFCGKLGRCPRNLERTLKIAKKFMPLDFPEDITPTMVMDPHNTKLALNLASVVKTWAEAFRRQVTDRVLRRDAEIPDGMKIQEMPGRRKIISLAKFKEIALRYVSPEVYEKALDASFGPIEEEINDKAPRGSKESTVKEFQVTLESLGAVERGPGFSFLKVEGRKNTKTKNT